VTGSSRFLKAVSPAAKLRPTPSKQAKRRNASNSQRGQLSLISSYFTGSVQMLQSLGDWSYDSAIT
jgi:hypothetical protein